MQPPDFVGFRKIARLNREICVTEKLDGSNGLVYITDDSDIYAGSRTRWIYPGKEDNYGFAAWVQDNEDELLKLGPGYHWGEYWGAGIQRRYDQKEKHFSLFREPLVLPACCLVVPVLYRGPFATNEIYAALRGLENNGSVASPGFMKPEGIVIYHTAANISFKITLDGDQAKGS